MPPSSLMELVARLNSLVPRRRAKPTADSISADENARLKLLTQMGDVAAEEGRLGEAEAAYRDVLQTEPRDLYALYRLTSLLHSRGSLADAATFCERGLAIDPNQVALLHRRASIATSAGDYSKALQMYERIVATAPDFEQLDAKLADTYSMLGRGAEAMEAFDRAIAKDPHNTSLQSDRLFVMNYFKLVDRETLFEEHRRWGAAQEVLLAGERRALTCHDAARDPERKLRVGYVSADLRHHAIAYFMRGVLKNHDRSRFEIHCFDVSIYAEDSITAEMRGSVDAWHRIADHSDHELAVYIHSRRIDILVDLSGHTAHNRMLVFARKPAPIQVSWFGYMNTTGLTTIDYRITDGYMDPPGESERFYTEKLFRIESMACFSPHPDSPAVSALPALASGTFTFASVNQWTKISEDVKALWGAILRDAPGARLLAIVRGGEFPGVREEVISQFVRFGASASQVVVYPSLPILDFLRLFSQVDVALDPFPYGGGTSSMHTIWMGVPIITLEGESEMSRAASGIARAVGLHDWVARDADDYRQIALKAVADPRSLIPIRADLRERMRSSSLTDAAKLTRNVENAYRAMWHAFSSK